MNIKVTDVWIIVEKAVYCVVFTSVVDAIHGTAKVADISIVGFLGMSYWNKFIFRVPNNLTEVGREHSQPM